ncbi:MAG: glycine dehydrogenase, partial [Litorimonas sp.]
MRYLPLSDADRAQMLDVVGVNGIDALFEDVPKSARLDSLVDLPRHASEQAVERHMARLSAKSVSAGSVPFFCGAGAYRHHVPATVDHLIQRSEFLTAYTPYQPEVSQGTLMALFEFQSQVALLTGMDVANASMYDGSTACAEAVVMAHRVARGRKAKAVLAPGLHPH